MSTGAGEANWSGGTRRSSPRSGSWGRRWTGRPRSRASGWAWRKFCRRVREGPGRASWEQGRQLLESLVARVIVTDGEVEIRYMVPVGADGDADRPCRLRSDY